jgi:hypothetical protein
MSSYRDVATGGTTGITFFPFGPKEYRNKYSISCRRHGYIIKGKSCKIHTFRNRFWDISASGKFSTELKNHTGIKELRFY